MKKLVLILFLTLVVSGICRAKDTASLDISQISVDAQNIKGYAGAEWGMTKEETMKALKENGKTPFEWLTDVWFKEKFLEDTNEGGAQFKFDTKGKLETIIVDPGMGSSTIFMGAPNKKFYERYGKILLALKEKYGLPTDTYEYGLAKTRPNKYVWKLEYTFITLDTEDEGLDNPSWKGKIWYSSCGYTPEDTKDADKLKDKL
jgi:hypothetical protein